MPCCAIILLYLMTEQIQEEEMSSAKPILHGVQFGFYYLNNYFMLPEGYADAAAFLDFARQAEEPLTVRAIILPENSEAGYEPYELGVCIAPYFIADYLHEPEEIVLEYPGEVYPVQVELLTQQEYNNRLRLQVMAHCPGCRAFGELNENDSSLSGHFEEITLDGFCPYRWETRKAPRNFNKELYEFSHSWTRWNYAQYSAEAVMDEIKYFLKLSYAFGSITDNLIGRTLTLCSKKPNLFQTVLTDILDKHISEHLQEGYHIYLVGCAAIDEASVMSLLTPRRIAATRRELKKYGVSIAILEYDPRGENSVMLFLSMMESGSLCRILHAEAGKAVCLLTGEYAVMQLRCASPMLEPLNTTLTLYGALKTAQYKIRFDMPETVLDAAPAESTAENKPSKKLQKAEADKVLKRDQVEHLFSYVSIRLEKSGCDHTLRFTRLWLENTLPPEVCAAAIEEIQNMGGYCDCEVLLNCYQDYDIE